MHYGHSNLLHGIEVTKSHSLILESVEVYCDGEGDTALVSACVAFADRLT